MEENEQFYIELDSNYYIFYDSSNKIKVLYKIKKEISNFKYTIEDALKLAIYGISENKDYTEMKKEGFVFRDNKGNTWKVSGEKIEKIKAMLELTSKQ